MGIFFHNFPVTILAQKGEHYQIITNITKLLPNLWVEGQADTTVEGAILTAKFAGEAGAEIGGEGRIEPEASLAGGAKWAITEMYHVGEGAATPGLKGKQPIVQGPKFPKDSEIRQGVAIKAE